MIIQAGWLKSLFSHLGKERGFHLNQLEKLSHFVPSLIETGPVVLNKKIFKCQCIFDSLFHYYLSLARVN